MNILYYHYYCTDLSYDILHCTLNEIKRSGLYDNLQTITINIVGENDKDHLQKIENDLLPSFNKLHLTKYRSEKLQQYVSTFSDLEIKQNHRLSIGDHGMELDTLKYLYEHISSNNLKCNVLYLHGKGSVNTGLHKGKGLNRKEWREEMSKYIIQNWRKCVANLKTQPHDGTNFSHDHYSGNFWWATTKHIKSNQCPIDYAKSNKLSKCKLRQSPYYSAEFWLLSQQTGED